MSAAPKCPKCYDEAMGCNTGEIDQNGYLDCLCGAADARRALEATLAISEAPTWMRDTVWRAHCLGIKVIAKQHQHLVETLAVIAAQDSGVTGNPTRSDCMAAVARAALKEDAKS